MRDQLLAGSKDNGKDGGQASEAPVTRDMSNPTQNQAILQLEKSATSHISWKLRIVSERLLA